MVGPAASLHRALELAEHHDLSAAVLDVRVGADKVEPLARRLAHRDVPFVFYSGQTEADEVRRRWPDAVFISKPAAPRTIVEAVRTTLKREL